MVVYPVLVAYHSAEWLPIAVESYLEQFPEDRILVVDNNPQPGETGWTAACRRERRWLSAHPRLDVISEHAAFPGAFLRKSHGTGMDLALKWCRNRGADVMLHFEPDCLVSGRLWRANLLAALECGAWMAGSYRKAWGPIHPTPSAWLVREVRSSFRVQPTGRSTEDPRYKELVDVHRLRSVAEAEGTWAWAKEHWDTADRVWFEAAIHDRAALVDAPDFRHFWFGSSGNHLPLEQLLAKYPELAAWFRQPDSSAIPRQPGRCSFRHSVRHGPDGEVAVCRLIERWSGVKEPRLCEVRQDACQACCASLEPSISSMNPVLASLVFGMAETVLERGGVDGCDRDSALHLRSWAEDGLDIRLPREGSPPELRRSEQPCQHLGAEVGTRIVATASGHDRVVVYQCRHPDHVETTRQECRRCRDWTGNRSEELVSIEQLVPPPQARRGPRVRRWAVGVTTAPRPRPTLALCLDSLFRAGWETPRLFVDSAVTIPDRFNDLPVTLHETRLGAWPNYYLALVELLMREPMADCFMLVQDDVIFDDRYLLRAHLEEILWPADPIGAVSLFCSKAYTRPTSGWHQLEEPWVWGALVFLFPRESAERFVTDREVLGHRCRGAEGLVNIDIQIGRWAHENGLPIFFPTPSLVQHIGDASSLWDEPAARAMGDRRADRYAGDCGLDTAR
jgi:hypothetical protein